MTQNKPIVIICDVNTSQARAPLAFEAVIAALRKAGPKWQTIEHIDESVQARYVGLLAGDEMIFAARLAKAVWIANGPYCMVELTIGEAGLDGYPSSEARSYTFNRN